MGQTREMKEQVGVAWGVVDGVGRIELRRPGAANALARPVAHTLARAIDEVLAAAPRVVVLSALGKVFCAGGDIQEFVAAGEGFERLVDEIIEPVHPAIERLAQAPMPVVSAVSGPIGGAGVALALCADFVLAAESMKLRTGYAAIGLSPDLGSSYFLARRVGSVRARQWFWLSDAIGAQECLRHGAVDAVFADAELPAAVEALVARLRQGARRSQAVIKQLCDGASTRSLAEQLRLEHEGMRACARSADAREGLRAFVERRAPRFED